MVKAGHEHMDEAPAGLGCVFCCEVQRVPPTTRYRVQCRRHNLVLAFTAGSVEPIGQPLLTIRAELKHIRLLE